MGPLLVLALPLVGLIEENRHEPEGTAGEGRWLLLTAPDAPQAPLLAIMSASPSAQPLTTSDTWLSLDNGVV